MQNLSSDDSLTPDYGYLEPADGTWVTDPPYTLPPSCQHCPCPTCPAHSRTFKPYWRLNEHMKLRHGWPRKTTQPNLDKRLGNKFGGRWKSKRIKTQASTEDGDQDDDQSSSDESQPPSHHLGAGKHQVDSTTSDNNYSDMHHTDSHLEELTPDLVKIAQTTAHIANLSLPARTHSTTSIRDEPMVTEIERYIHELKRDLSRIATDTVSPELTESRKTMMAGLQNILGSSLIQINTVLPAHQARAIWPFYRALSHRASFGSMVPRAAPAQLTTLSVANTPAKTQDETTSEPKSKLKLVLKLSSKVAATPST